MEKFKLSTLLVVNIFFTNFYFLRFEQSDYAIAIRGLNNLSEDLRKIGFNNYSELSYFWFSVIENSTEVSSNVSEISKLAISLELLNCKKLRNINPTKIISVEIIDIFFID